MVIPRNSGRAAALGLIYFAGVAASCLMGRPDGGVALIWLPGAVLAAGLAGAEIGEWAILLTAAAIGNVLAAGLFGLGWALAPFLTLANLAEAVAVAMLARHTVRHHWPDATFEMISIFLLGAILVIPAGSAAIAAAAVSVLRHAGFVAMFAHWMLAHAMGLVTILPFVMTVFARLRQPHRRAADHSATPVLAGVLIVATMALLVACVFVQPSRWALAAPVLFALFAAVWADTLVASAMPMLAALIAVPLTVAGLGPLAPGLDLSGDRMQMAQVFVGLLACCSLPVMVEQARRRRELASLARSTAHFEAKSARADDLIDELRRAVLTDPLTGLPNRRAFFDALATAAGSDEQAVVAMIDIDHFKAVNDRFGHAAGDEVLRQVAEIARGSFRSADLVARIGGEEFAVILRAITLDQARGVCQRLVDRLSESRLECPGGPVRVTISTGIAVIGSDGDAALASADEALYEAKRSGRSRLVCVA